MIRSEFLIAGCILVIVGLCMCVVGHKRSEPTQLERAVTVIEQLSGSRAPQQLMPAKAPGYILSGTGVVVFCCGIALILASRAGIHGQSPTRSAETPWRSRP